jgi:hypothetical protein
VQAYGVSAFALAPFGPTAMIEAVAGSSNVPAQASAQFRRMLEQGSDDLAQSVKMLLFLVSGQADALTGRHFSSEDVADDLRQRIGEIVRDDLYTLRRYE